MFCSGVCCDVVQLIEGYEGIGRFGTEHSDAPAAPLSVQLRLQIPNSETQDDCIAIFSA